MDFDRLLLLTYFFSSWIVPLAMGRHYHHKTMRALSDIKLQQKFLYWDVKQVLNKKANV